MKTDSWLAPWPSCAQRVEPERSADYNRFTRPTMIRKQLLTPADDHNGFSWRGTEPSRIEGFSDAVFAFAVTLLVVSLEVPKTFTELLSAMRSFVPFGISFLMLMQIWHWHYEYFGRYGLRDRLTSWLNAVLLFVVLFYVYPMKFLFTVLTDQLVGLDPAAVLPSGAREPVLVEAQASTLMLVYGVGFIAVHGLFAVLYVHAYRRRTALALSGVELVDTRAGIGRFVLMVLIGLTSLLLAVSPLPSATSWAGWVYLLIGPVRTLHARRTAARRLGLGKRSAA